MSKICIITCRNIFDSPCLSKYEELINTKYDLVYWNRAGIDEKSFANNTFIYQKAVSLKTRRLKKFFLYCGFSLFCRKVLKFNTYEKLIVFPTQTGWLLSKLLKEKYKGKYVLDIRDYAGENNFLIYNLTKRLIKNAGYISITSEKYKSFLPNGNYHISHNLQKISEDIIDDYRNNRRKNKIINISFIGSVRFLEKQKQIISIFKNDNRFILNFIGRGAEQLSDYCIENQVENVNIIGFFKREEMGKFYQKTDISLNVYGNNDPFLDYALSNKIYSSAIMGMPILVSPYTYMAEIVSKYQIGFIFDESNPFILDELYAYYFTLSFEELYMNAARFLSDVYTDENEYEATLQKYLQLGESYGN